VDQIKVKRFRLEESGIRKALGELEAEIMERVWRKKVATVREIHAELKGKRPIAYTTVMTVMTRLANKGILTKDKDGKHYIYRPTVSKEEFRQSVIRSIVAAIRRDLGSGALAYFVENLPADDQTLSELERLIKEKRRKLNEE
jgi:predicted transcriptional regulator